MFLACLRETHEWIAIFFKKFSKRKKKKKDKAKEACWLLQNENAVASNLLLGTNPNGMVFNCKGKA